MKKKKEKKTLSNEKTPLDNLRISWLVIIVVGLMFMFMFVQMVYLSTIENRLGRLEFIQMNQIDKIDQINDKVD